MPDTVNEDITALVSVYHALDTAAYLLSTMHSLSEPRRDDAIDLIRQAMVSVDVGIGVLSRTRKVPAHA